MKLSEIVRQVQIIIDDPAVLVVDIVTEINDQYVAAAALSHIQALLRLESVTVAAGALSVAMPSAYQHSLLSATSTTNRRNLGIRTNQKALYNGYDMVGDGDSIDEVAVDGATLHVRPKAGAEETMSLLFYAKPTLLVADGDEPDYLPEALHKKILVSGTAAELLPDVDMDPQKKVALIQLHAGRAGIGLANLVKLYPYAPRHTPKARRRARWF